MDAVRGHGQRLARRGDAALKNPPRLPMREPTPTLPKRKGEEKSPPRGRRGEGRVPKLPMGRTKDKTMKNDTLLSLLLCGLLLGLFAGLSLAPAEADVQFTTLHSFSQPSKTNDNYDGANPYVGLIQGTDGNFYGTTINGGTADGTVFQITPSGTVTTLHFFSGGDGSFPTEPYPRQRRQLLRNDHLWRLRRRWHCVSADAFRVAHHARQLHLRQWSQSVRRVSSRQRRKLLRDDERWRHRKGRHGLQGGTDRRLHNAPQFRGIVSQPTAW